MYHQQDLSKEEVKAWRLEYVSAEVLRRIEAEVSEAMLGMADGSTIGDTTDETAQVTAFQAGYIRGLRWLLEFDGDITEQEKEKGAET